MENWIVFIKLDPIFFGMLIIGIDIIQITLTKVEQNIMSLMRWSYYTLCKSDIINISNNTVFFGRNNVDFDAMLILFYLVMVLWIIHQYLSFGQVLNLIKD